MSMLLTISACILLLASVEGCSLPPGGCTVKACAAKTLGDEFGVYKGPAGTSAGSPGAGPFNYEMFSNLGGNLLMTKPTIRSSSSCCTACAATPGCSFWHFYTGTPVPASWIPAEWEIIGGTPTLCYLLTGNAGNPIVAPHNVQETWYSLGYSASWFGGSCNPAGNVINDPHFTGAHGTKFDFNGDVDKTFCLVSDKDLHVNMNLGGYTTNGTVPELRTWIKELGFIWVKDGQKHTIILKARRGKDQERGSGYLAVMEVDGKPATLPSVGETVMAPHFQLQFLSHEKEGMYEVDAYKLEISTMMEMSIKLRPAHPALQSADDAQVHFNVYINTLTVTPNVHGVLGQTFRSTSDRIQRAMKYTELSTLLKGPVIADGITGRGFLDGDKSDYVSSSLLKGDCIYSAFRSN